MPINIKIIFLLQIQLRIALLRIALQFPGWIPEFVMLFLQEKEGRVKYAGRGYETVF